MIKDLTARQLRELEINYQLEPWGEARDDLRMGILCSTIANFRPYRGKNSKTFKPADFMPCFTTDEGRETKDARSRQHRAVFESMMKRPKKKK